MRPSAWKPSTPFVDTVRKMRELALRAQRIDLALRIARAKAMISALAPSEKSNG